MHHEIPPQRFGSWSPGTQWAWVEFGVREHQAPVALSNGWGDDNRFAELTGAQRAQVLALFNGEKDRQRS